MKFITTLLMTLALVFGSCAAAKDDPALKARRDLYHRVNMSLVRITHATDDPKLTAVCTGFIVDSAKGWVFTVAHCIEKDKTIFINELPSEVIKMDDTLAVLKYPIMAGPPLDIAKEPVLLEEVMEVGWGYGDLEVLIRHVAAIIDGDVLLDNPGAQGMSGGPLVNQKGEVVAIGQRVLTPFTVGCGPNEMRKFLSTIK